MADDFILRKNFVTVACPDTTPPLPTRPRWWARWPALFPIWDPDFYRVGGRMVAPAIGLLTIIFATLVTRSRWGSSYSELTTDWGNAALAIGIGFLGANLVVEFPVKLAFALRHVTRRRMRWRTRLTLLVGAGLALIAVACIAAAGNLDQLGYFALGLFLCCAYQIASQVWDREMQAMAPTQRRPGYGTSIPAGVLFVSAGLMSVPFVLIDLCYDVAPGRYVQKDDPPLQIEFRRNGTVRGNLDPIFGWVKYQRYGPGFLDSIELYEPGARSVPRRYRVLPMGEELKVFCDGPRGTYETKYFMRQRR